METKVSEKWKDIIPMMEGSWIAFNPTPGTSKVLAVFFDEKIISVKRDFAGTMYINFITLVTNPDPMEKPTKDDITEFFNLCYLQDEFLQRVQKRIVYKLITPVKSWCMGDDDTIGEASSYYQCSFQDNGLFALLEGGLAMRDEEYGAGYSFGDKFHINESIKELFKGEAIIRRNGDEWVYDWAVAKLVVTPVQDQSLLLDFYAIDFSENAENPTDLLLANMGNRFNRLVLNDDDACTVLGNLNIKLSPNEKFGYAFDGTSYSPYNNRRFNIALLNRLEKLFEKQKDWGMSQREKMNRQVAVVKRESNPFAVLQTIKNNVRQEFADSKERLKAHKKK